MSLNAPVLSDEGVAALVKDTNRQSLGGIEGFVGTVDRERMRRFVAKAVRELTGGYARPAGPGTTRRSGLDEVARPRTVQDIIERIHRHGTGRSRRLPHTRWSVMAAGSPY